MKTALHIRDLQFSHVQREREPRWTLSLPALSLEPAEQVLLTAPSGKGKSTLLQLIAGLLDPSSGTIEIAGTAIHSLHGAARDRFRGAHLGMIFQTFNLLQGFSASENILAALMFSAIPPKEHASLARDLLARLGIERANAPVETLSIGQQQRVAVARAVSTRPAIVLADEPTASLDPENAAAAMDLIQNACRDSGAALLCVSHDPSMTDRFTRRERLGGSA